MSGYEDFGIRRGRVSVKEWEDAGMELHFDGIEEVEEKLGNLKSKAPIVIYRTINRAAGKVRTEAKKEVAARYYIQQKDVYKTIRIIKASRAKLSAEITSRGGPIALSKFHMTKSNRKPVKVTFMRNGKRKYSPNVYKVSVKKSGGQKPLDEDPKAFYAFMKAGKSGTHEGVFERIGRKRLSIQQLYGPAVPSMMKNDDVLDRIKEEASGMLAKRIDAEINNILQRG